MMIRFGLIIKKVSLLLILFTVILQGQTKTIAVLDFDGDGVSQSEARTLTNRLRDELIKTNVFIVLERGKMEEVLKEQGFQQTGCTTSECAVEIGNLLGVQRMVGGSIGKVGNVYTISARIIDVESGAIFSSANYDLIGDIGLLLVEGMKNVAYQLIGMKPPMTKPRVTQLNQHDANPNIKKNITPQITNKKIKKNKPEIDYSSNKKILSYSFCCILIFSLIAESIGL